jgi:PAS domain S-box-containing protein
MTIPPDYAALFAASPYPYLLIDPQFILIGANPAYLRATQRSAEDLVGKHIFEAFPADPSDPDSTNLQEVGTSIELAIATRRPHTSALLRYAVPIATPDGTVFDQRYWSAIHTPVFDQAGAVIFVSQNAIDVTDLYRFDAATRKYYLRQDANAVPDMPQMNQPQMHEAMTRILTAERSQLQILFDQAPGFIAVLTGANHVVDTVNDAFYKLMGYRSIVGRPALEALPELAGQGVGELLDRAFASAAPIVLHEHRLALRRSRDAAPEDRYVDLLIQPIIGQDGRVTALFVQGNDVTGAQQAALALSEKVQQLEDIQARQAFLLQLADRLRPLSDPDQVTAVACELLGRQLGAARVLYADIDEQRAGATRLGRRRPRQPGGQQPVHGGLRSGRGGRAARRPGGAQPRRGA